MPRVLFYCCPPLHCEAVYKRGLRVPYQHSTYDYNASNMQWQELTFTVLVVLQSVALSQGRPHHEQLVFYNHLVPRQSANLVIVPQETGA
ncbi:hypothetical protein L9F63_009937, partial [Diploptera punctata]